MRAVRENTIPTRAEVLEEDYFSKGLAVCQPIIMNDSIYCRFRDEVFEFASHDLDYLTLNMARTGYEYANTPVERLRKLQARLEKIA